MTSKRDSFLMECAPRINEDEPARLIRCAGLLEDFCVANGHADLMNEYLEEHLSSSAIETDEYREILTSGRFLIIAQSADTLVAVIRQPYVVERINSAPIRYVERNVSPGTVSLTRYALPPEFQDNRFDESLALTTVSQETDVSRALIVKELNDVIDITKVSDLPRIAVRVAFPLAGSYEWSFSRDTLRAVAHTSLSLNDSGVAGMLDLLGSMRSPRTAPILEKLYDRHPEHFVRWKAVQTLAKLDPARGLELVKKAAHESHPMIRKAARATLERMPLAS